jgi:NADPH:quinone reductase-like Zn-dependent oxidoreductase
MSREKIGDAWETVDMNQFVQPASAKTKTMLAIIRSNYGAPDVMKLETVARPIPDAGEVLVRVHAAGVSIGDHHVVTGKPYIIRLSPHGGLFRPRNQVPGQAMAGVVVAVGASVTTFQIGDEVYGDVISAFAEYVAVAAKRIAPKPRNLSFEEAACTPWGVAALQGLRDAGRLQKGQRVLINGASGGVGTWAVQIAKALGAEVTAICSTRNVDMVRRLGADAVIDYTKQDFTQSGPCFDVVFDTVGNRALSDFQGILTPCGAFVSCSGGSSGTKWLFRMVWMLVVSRFTHQKLVTLITSPNREDLLALNDLIEIGKTKPVVECSYALDQIVEALNHVGKGHAQGQSVIRIAT